MADEANNLTCGQILSLLVQLTDTRFSDSQIRCQFSIGVFMQSCFQRLDKVCSLHDGLLSKNE